MHHACEFTSLRGPVLRRTITRTAAVLFCMLVGTATMEMRTARSAELRGIVRFVDRAQIHLEVKGELLPQVGDAVEIAAPIPGLDETAQVAVGKVTQVTRRCVLAKIESASGRVEPGQQASIVAVAPTSRAKATETSSTTSRPPTLGVHVVPKRVSTGIMWANDPLKVNALLVTLVLDHGEESSSGLQEGDVIQNFDGRPTTSVETLKKFIGECDVGDSIEVGVIRGSRLLSLHVHLSAKPDDAQMVRQLHAATMRGNAYAYYVLSDCYQLGVGTMRDERQARSYLETAAAKGVADAQFALGVALLEAKDGEENKREAVRWFRRAAEQGFSDAQQHLGYCYESGLGIDKDVSQAAYWYRTAAEAGNARAQASLGRMLLDGLGIARNEAAAAEWFRKAAEQGDADGQAGLGAMLRLGRGVAQNFDEALRHLRPAAKQEHPVALYHLGAIQFGGQGTEASRVLGLGLMTQAATKGLADAQTAVGRILLNDPELRDYSLAKSMLEAAAGQGSVEAEYNLGYMYREGLGVPKDDRRCFDYCLRAAEKGYAQAQFAVALIIQQGNVVERDSTVAAQWYQRAADQGHHAARSNLAAMYRDGDGVEQDVDKAFELFQQSAEAGNREAQNSLGVLLVDGKHYKPEYDRGIEWLRKAAAQGLGDAERNLAILHENGWGFPRSRNDAIAHYRKALQLGLESARADLRRLGVGP